MLRHPGQAWTDFNKSSANEADSFQTSGQTNHFSRACISAALEHVPDSGPEGCWILDKLRGMRQRRKGKAVGGGTNPVIFSMSSLTARTT
jgi:hypothetical protein